ncbi:restriction endonuclease subunit S [Bilophila wadsworthia]|uniref:restriction endonuclease subunit S n=1 Tax=Bilophila wadsworthia TaxID=35833 RepID=UPI00267476DB|nr:restriction endonuclease subunit S [Bilophila wadsworthia]
MSRIDNLIAKLCPNGVEYKALEEVCSTISAGGDLPEHYEKGQLIPTDRFPYPIYSNGSNKNSLYGFTDTYRIDQDAVTVSARGTIGYHAVRKKFFTPIVRLITLLPDNRIITAEFLNYALDITEIGHSGGSIPQLTVPNIKKVCIPVPPLEIQREIVKVLDTFTKLEAELEAELEARRRQYHYYRDQLLNFEGRDDVQWMTLGEVCKIQNGYAFKSSLFKTNGLPILRISNIQNERIDTKNLVYFNEKDYKINLYQFEIKKGDIVIAMSGATTGKIAISNLDTKYYLNQRVGKFIPKDNLLNKFLYFILRTHVDYFYQISAGGGAQPNLSSEQIKKISIPVPSLEEQTRIVTTLDKFDALVNDLSSGLPAEIAARRKQYEYYRDRLLTFKEAQ